MKDVLEIIPVNLVKLRKQNNLTQIELSQKINYSDKAISRWEKGEVMPSVEILSKLAEVYQVPIEYFFSEHLDQAEKKTKEREKYLYLLIMCSLMLVVWTITVIAFFMIKSFFGEYMGKIFLWALPLTAFVVKWCTKYFFENKFYILTSSFCVWLTIIAIYIQWFYLNLWHFFLFGIPVQITIILIDLLNRVRRPTEKNKKNATVKKIEEILSKGKERKDKRD